MRKTPSLRKNALALAVLCLTASSGIMAQSANQKAAEKPKQAKVKVLQKAGGEFLVYDTTLTIAPGMTVGDAVKNLKITGVDFEKLNTKILSDASVIDVKQIKEIRVVNTKSSDSSVIKQIRISLGNTTKDIELVSLAADSAIAQAKGKLIITRRDSIVGGKSEQDGNTFTFVLPSSRAGKQLHADTLSVRRLTFATAGSWRSKKTDAPNKISLQGEKEGGKKKIKIYYLNSQGKETLLNLSESDLAKYDPSKITRIVVLSSTKEVQAAAKKVITTNKQASKLGVQVFPNPTSGLINLSFQVPEKAATKVRIVDRVCLKTQC